MFSILSSWSSIPCPSFSHTLANFENKKKWIFLMSLQLGKLQEKELFFQTLYLGLILRGASQLFYTFSSRVGIYRERGGDGTSSILCICLHSLLAKKIQSVKLKPRSNFSVQSFLLLVYLVFTLLLVLAFYSVNKCCFINIFHDIFLG